jgi:HEAT repeat protein
MRTDIFLVTAGLLISGFFCATESSFGQGEAPRVVNAKLETRTAGANLSATMKEVVASADGPMWIGYEVAAVPGEHGDCCGRYEGVAKNQSKGVWHLENENGKGGGSVHERSDLNAKGNEVLWILYRVDRKRIERILVSSNQCELDAGGLRLIWLKDVKSAESVAFLSGMVHGQEKSGGERNSIGEQALMAIALDADAEADKALARFSAPEQPEKRRERASFWMGAARGAAGLAQLKTMAKTDPSSEVRAQVSFGLFVSKEPGATEEIIRMAREDGSPRVRGQALFWLAQKAGAKAENAIAGAITNDPDTEVKKKAVFALSQMPKDEGVPKLIEVAEKNKNTEVRKQAMFWLGQTEDPRALAFFERVLKN